MKKLLIFSLVSWYILTLHLTHSLWSTKDKGLAKVTDVTWNYCDLKCLYL